MGHGAFGVHWPALSAWLRPQQWMTDSSEDSLHESAVVDLLNFRSGPIMPDGSLAMARSRERRGIDSCGMTSESFETGSDNAWT